MNTTLTTDSFMTEANKETLLGEIKGKSRPCWASTVKTFMETFVLSGHQKDIELKIPAYQREYAWTEREINRLLADLENASRNQHETYHLGTIIFHRELDEDKCILNIIDGQQRLRTFELLASLCEGYTIDDAHGVLRPRSEEPAGLFSQMKTICEKKAQSGELLGIYEALEKGTLVCIVVDQEDAAFQLFATQNGLGAELTAENLLKAYHYHEMTHGPKGDEELDNRAYMLEEQWEKTVAGTSSHLIKHPVLTSHLFLARRWARGEKKKERHEEEPGKRGKYVIGFDKNYHLGEYKGVTLGKNLLPVQNSYNLFHLLREEMERGGLLAGLLQRSLVQRIEEIYCGIAFRLDPFVSICQPIINGKDFFEYACTYAQLAVQLFETLTTKDEELVTFKSFYRKCCPNNNSRWLYSLEVYETFVLMVVDHFGTKGLSLLYHPLWILAYYERLTIPTLRRESAGEEYGNRVCKLLASQASLDEVVARIKEWAKEASDDKKIKQNMPDEKPTNTSDIKVVFRDFWDYYNDWSKWQHE